MNSMRDYVGKEIMLLLLFPIQKVRPYSHYEKIVLFVQSAKLILLYLKVEIFERFFAFSSSPPQNYRSSNLALVKVVAIAIVALFLTLKIDSEK